METENPFSCDVCGKSFKNKRNMNNHKMIHTGEKPYACETCEKTFIRKDKLTDHKRSHTGERPYECDICAKTFTKNQKLTDHKKIHTGEISFTCDACLKTFTRKDQFMNHKRIHTGERPYKCDLCEKTFTVSSSLNNHKKLHYTSEKSHVKPYSCDICQKSYTQSSKLSQHKKTSTHMNAMENKNKDSSSTLNPFVDCVETIKVEDIKEEIDEEESVDDPLSIQGEKTKGDSDNIVTELKEELIDDDSLCVPEIDNSGDGENNDELFSHQKTKNRIVYEVKSEKIKEEENVDVPLHELVGKRLFSCDVCREKFTERIVLMMHKDINHSQPIPQSVEDSLPSDKYSESGVKQEVKEDLKESDEGQGVEDSNLETDHLVDCSQYLQVEMNLTK